MASVPSGAGSTGEVLFRGNWETGNIDQWTWSAQCSNVGSAETQNRPDRGTLTLVRTPVAQGRYAARFALPAYPAATACEVLRKRTLAVGTDDYYAEAFYFPSTWREPSFAWGMAITQMNYELIWGAPLALIAHRNRVDLVLQSGFCEDSTARDPGCTFSSGPGGNLRALHIVPARMRLNVWHQVIVHVRWAADRTGVVEGWHRLRGRGPWRRTADVRGYPTVQWSVAKPVSADMPTSDKAGAYRGPAAYPISMLNDAFCVATSLAAAKSCFK
jgi:Polysaccharide lyase